MVLDLGCAEVILSKVGIFSYLVILLDLFCYLGITLVGNILFGELGTC